MPKPKQVTYLVITTKGEKYYQQLLGVGYVRLPSDQRAEWNILHDLVSRGPEPIKMSTFLTEGRDSVLGDIFERLSERPQGQLLVEDYGKKLHHLIEQGYIKASKDLPQ